MLWNKNYNSAISNLSDDLRKTIVDFIIASFTSTLYASLPYKSK